MSERPIELDTYFCESCGRSETEVGALEVLDENTPGERWLCEDCLVEEEG